MFIAGEILEEIARKMGYRNGLTTRQKYRVVNKIKKISKPGSFRKEK